MSVAALLLPNQLFAEHPALAQSPDKVVLFEDPLFFGDPQYPARMHKQKLWLHRASMMRYHQGLIAQGRDATIWGYERDVDACLKLFQSLSDAGMVQVVMLEPVDFIADRRLRHAAAEVGIALEILPNPGFLNTAAQNASWRAGRKRWFMADYYKSQRRRLDVLMDGDQPKGGRWSFDEDNRKKVPKAQLGALPWIDWPRHDATDEAARRSIEADFPEAVGDIDTLYYPSSHQAAADWLQQFLERRFAQFGDYEDAIVAGENWLWHGVLTPALNIGLLTPKQVLDAALDYADRKSVPLNSVEGFVRQIIGWREFMRATYDDIGVPMRRANHRGHTRPMPSAFYDGTTGLDPVDDTIRRVLKTGYCHHIERLMVLGGAMFLCEIAPDDIYRWFMEMFVDSYDWVMVPNVYGMSQHADGGLITTKPYFSGSNYIRKMSHWDQGPWAAQWDALYWRFIFKHADAIGRNPRWTMMCRAAARMPTETKRTHLETANAFLANLR